MKYAFLFLGFAFLGSTLVIAAPDLLQREAYLKAFELIQTVDPSQKALSSSVSLDDIFIDLAKRVALSGDDALFWDLLRYSDKTPALAIANQRIFSVVLVELVVQNQTNQALVFFEKCPDDRKLIVGKPLFVVLIYRNQLEDAKRLIAMLPAGFQTQQLMIELAQAYFRNKEFQKTIDMLLPLPNSPQKQTLLTAALKEMISRDLMDGLALTEYRSYLTPENDDSIDLLQEVKALVVEQGEEIFTRALALKSQEQQALLLSPLVALYVQNNRIDDAKSVISRASGKELKDALQLRLVRELIKVKNKAEAVRSVQAIRDPQMNAEAYFELAKELVKEDRFEDALTLMKQAKTSEYAQAKAVDLMVYFAESPQYLAATMALDTLPPQLKDQAMLLYIVALAKKNYGKAKDFLPKINSLGYRQNAEDKLLGFLLENKRLTEGLALAKELSPETKPEALLRVAESAIQVSNLGIAKESLSQVEPLLFQMRDLNRLIPLSIRLQQAYSNTSQNDVQKAFMKQFEPYLKNNYQKSTAWPAVQILMAQLYLKAGDFSKALSIAKSLKNPLLEAKVLMAAPTSAHLTANQVGKGQKAIQKLK